MTTNELVREDPAYQQLFQITNETARRGGVVIEDIYSGLARLRDQGPLLKGSIHDFLGEGLPPHLFTHSRPHFAALDFETNSSVVNNDDIFSSRTYDEYFPNQALGRTIINMGGLEHRRIRGAVQALFTMLYARDWWKPRWVEEIVDVLLSDFERKGRADLNQQLCARLPMHTITRGLGLDAEEALAFRVNLMATLSNLVTDDERAAAAQVVRQTMLNAVEIRRREPRDDILSALTGASFTDDDGSVYQLDDEEILSFCRLLMAAGGGTTWRQLGITLHALLTDPANWAAVRDDRSLVDRAINESTRWNTTAPLFYRIAERDVRLSGVDIPAGARIEACFAAANRDPTRWDDPDTFRLDRPFQRHLAFGGGPHTCIGRFVAQSEMSVAINALADRVPDLRLDPDAPAPIITGGLEQRGVDHMRVVF
jgi:cytochrome P450